MRLNSLVDGVSKGLNKRNQTFDAVGVESEGVPLGGLIEAAAVDSVPQSDVGVHLYTD